MHCSEVSNASGYGDQYFKINRFVLLCLCSFPTWNWNVCGWVTSHLCWHKKNGFSCHCYQLCLFLCHLPLHVNRRDISYWWQRWQMCNKQMFLQVELLLAAESVKCGCFIEFDYILNFPALIWSNFLIDLRSYLVTLKIFWVAFSKQLCIWTVSGFSWSHHIPQSFRVYLIIYYYDLFVVNSFLYLWEFAVCSVCRIIPYVKCKRVSCQNLMMAYLL